MRGALSGAAVVLLVACGSSPARPLDEETVRPDVAIEGIAAHLEALQTIADANGGNRAAGTPGYDESARYVHARLREAGYDVEYQEFPFDFWEQVAPTGVDVAGETFTDGDDFKALIYSAPGDVESRVTPVGFDPNASAEGETGCEFAHFRDFPGGDVALLRPGPCLRRDQVINAQTAGASAVVVSYPDWRKGEVRRPTLLSPAGISVPALSASADVGLALAEAATAGETVRIFTDTRTEQRMTRNVIAETVGGDDGAVVMVGAHLDSAIDGPGINDNGSGSATILELAVATSDARPQNTLRFAFWGGEELGLLGSTHYVDGSSSEERGAIAAYLNFDMLASPNFVRFVYGEEDAPAGSGELGELFADHLDSEGLDHELLDLGGGSDHGPFMRAGIPVGGLFTGATEPKTSAQAETYGGDPGVPADPCYHLACDRTDHIDEQVLEEMARAVAAVVLSLATADDIRVLLGTAA